MMLKAEAEKMVVVVVFILYMPDDVMMVQCGLSCDECR